MDFCQEIFNKITFGLLKQNQKYEYPKMKGWHTVKSPLQLMIPESDYEPEMEECSIFNFYYFRHAGYVSREINLIQDLKWVHDNMYVKYWRAYFYIIAQNFSLRPGV